jgi:predicted metalloprotease with PDZ domain
LFRLSIDTWSVKLKNAPRGVLAMVMVLLCSAISASADAPPTRETFSVTYTVEIDAHDPARARVRWELAGIDEIERLRLRFDPARFDDFTGSGTLEHRRGEILWWPSGPYAELRYVVHVDHRRATDKGYDSYAGDGWVLSRTTAFFPRSAALFRRDVEPHPESRARLVFRLPNGWDSATVFPSDGPNRYVVETPRQRFDHPRGWMLLGHLRRTEAVAAGTAVTIARAPGVTIPVDRLLDLLTRVVPEMNALFDRPLPRLLIVLGPDPMWRGGLSGEESYYMHGERPLRTRDHTSPYLHELFHVAAPFRPNADAHWVTEGLAEYYSIELPRRLGIISEPTYQRALELFAEHGVWGQDFTRARIPALRNNSAPLLMYVIDQRIRAATGGQRGLDAVVRNLAHEGGVVSTGRFLGAVQRVAAKSFVSFFRRHVYRGEQPAIASPLP